MYECYYIKKFICKFWNKKSSEKTFKEQLRTFCLSQADKADEHIKW